MKDKYGREIDYLRLSVTDNCNLRCIYCMDEDFKDFLSLEQKLTDDEIIKIVDASAKLGIKKIRITGGEPLVRKDIEKLIGRIGKVEGIQEIYLTTNGILLLEKVEELARNGVKGVNISLDSLKEERFKELTRVGDLKKVLLSIDKCLEYGLKVKLNTVVVNDINKDEIIDFVKLTILKPIDIRFIELMPIGIGKAYRGTSNNEILQIIRENNYKVTQVGKNQSGGPAKYIKINNALGKIGFISAVSDCFCTECNRVRVTADGFLKQCLHFKYGVNLKELINNGISTDKLCKVIEENIYNKPEKHLFDNKNNNEEIKMMSQIGG